MRARTSATHPIRVDFVPKHFHGLDGQLGMTFAPGKKAQGIDGRWDRDLTADLVRLRKEYATDVLVSLIEEHELGELRIEALPVAAKHARVSLVRFAIPDGGVPVDAAEVVRKVIIWWFRQQALDLVGSNASGLGRGLFQQESLVCRDRLCDLALSLEAMGIDQAGGEGLLRSSEVDPALRVRASNRRKRGDDLFLQCQDPVDPHTNTFDIQPHGLEGQIAHLLDRALEDEHRYG